MTDRVPDNAIRRLRKEAGEFCGDSGNGSVVLAVLDELAALRAERAASADRLALLERIAMFADRAMVLWDRGDGFALGPAMDGLRDALVRLGPAAPKPPTAPAVAFLDALRAQAGAVKSLVNRNSAGVLWSSDWRYEEGRYWQNTVCSGVFDHYKPYDRERALEIVAQTLETIERTRRDEAGRAGEGS